MSKSGNFAGAPTLPRWALRVARAIAETIFDDGQPPSRERLDAFVADVADFSRGAGFKTRVALSAGLLLLQLAPIWVVGKLSRFTKLSRPDRLLYMARAEHTKMPLVVQGMKAVFCIIWFELNADLLPPVVRKEPRAGVAYAEKLRQEASS